MWDREFWRTFLITALTINVAADLELARQWRPGTVKYDGPRGGTEKGFRR